MSDASFLKAQREYDAMEPPEAPEPCEVHGWEYNDDEPEMDECPQCKSAREAWEDDAYDRWKDEQYEREQEEPNFDREGW